MAKTNDGKAAEKEFERHIASLGKRAFLYRFDDAAAIRAKTGAAGYAKKQPSDYLLTLDGVTSYTEVKSCSNPHSFPFSQLEDGQHTAAKQIVAAGGPYLIFVFSTMLKRWFVISYAEVLSSSKSSIKWTEMRPYNV